MYNNNKEDLTTRFSANKQKPFYRPVNIYSCCHGNGTCFNLTIKTLKFVLLSVYEEKNNCCLFERLFKVKKNGVFLFGISFFVMEIFTSLYYASEESDDVIGGSTKTVQHSIMNISRNIKAVFFKVGTRNEHHKRKKMLPIVHVTHGPVSIKTKISRFYLKQGSSIPNSLKGRVNTIWEPCVFGVRPSVSL